MLTIRLLSYNKSSFAQQKTNAAEQESNRHVIKATKEISMQHLILLAVLSMMVLSADDLRLFMLHWAARASNVLNPRST